MNNRIILEKYIKKLDNSEKSNAKELRLTPIETRELHLALVKVLLDHAETVEKNRQLIAGFTTSETQTSQNIHGGSFK